MTIKEVLGVKTCPNCYHMAPGALRVCEHCGHEFLPSRARITPEIIAEAYARRCAGESWEAIAAGAPYEPCSLRRAVYIAGYRIPREVGRPRFDKPAAFSFEELNEFLAMRAKGLRWKQVARGTRHTWEFVKDACYRYKQMMNRGVQN